MSCRPLTKKPDHPETIQCPTQLVPVSQWICSSMEEKSLKQIIFMINWRLCFCFEVPATKPLADTIWWRIDSLPYWHLMQSIKVTQRVAAGIDLLHFEVLLDWPSPIDNMKRKIQHLCSLPQIAINTRMDILLDIQRPADLSSLLLRQRYPLQVNCKPCDEQPWK